MNTDVSTQSWVLNEYRRIRWSYKTGKVNIAESKGEASNCNALSFCVGMYVRMYVCMYVCMYVYPQIAQCNSMLVYVYPQRLHNTILCSHMYVCHACATIAQFSGQNVPPGMIAAPDYCLACVARILWKNTTTSVSSPCPAHCASRTISVTLWRYTLMFAECVALWTIRFDSGVV